MTNLPEHHAYLLLGKLTGTLSTEETLELEQLILENPSLEQAYEALVNALPADQVARSFDHLNEKGYWRDLTAELQNNDIAPAGHQVVPFGSDMAPTRKTTTRIIYQWLTAAAIIALVATGGWLFFREPEKRSDKVYASSLPSVELKLADGKVIDLTRQEGGINAGTAQLTNADKSLTYSPGSTPPSGTNTLTVPVGMDYKISLSDGSEVWLNAATTLDFPLSFSGNTREIRIDGEAYIKVAKDTSKPFIVHLPQSSVQVLGTAFNINTYDTGVEKVALVEGSVHLKAPAGSVLLEPGNQAIYTEGKSLTQHRFDSKYVLSWRKGLYYFDEVTLEEISRVIPRWYGMQVVIDNPSIHHKKFVGVLDRNQPIRAFQDDIKEIAGIDSYVDKKNVLHFK